MSARLVFEAGAESYASFRIPALVKAGPELLAFCEGRRHCAADHGEIDIVLRRSIDNGRTWGPLTVVASAPGMTVGNPAPVVIPGTDIVILLTVRNGAAATEREILGDQVSAADSRRVFVQRSEDRGRSFSEPRDITAAVKRDDWGWYATGPGHGIALRRTGRLVIPCNHSVLGPTVTPALYGAHCIYSDDGGAQWTIGFIDDNAEDRVNANENTVAELADGRLYFNARNQEGRADGTRVDTYSADGGRTLERPYESQPQLHTAVVQGTLLQFDNGPLLYSGPYSDRRERIGIQVSHDNGMTWSLGHLIDNRPAAYSDMVQLDDRGFGLLYETGNDGPYEQICFQRVELSQLTAGNPPA